MVLTEKDLDEINRIMDEKFDDKLKGLPTKDEFYAKMDEVIGELKAIREEHPIMSSQIANHKERITSLESSSKD